MTILLADEIRKLCQGREIPPMIEPFYANQLRPASYQLTLGDEVHVGGEQRRLGHSNEVILEPHQVAVVCTRETLRIPRHLIARWSLRVTNIYEGLLWTGGPQVDPGWEGPLFCPIYNLAERNVVLKYGQPMFTIDFSYTTEIGEELKALKQKPEYARTWFTPRPHTNLAEHDRHRLRSAPYEALRELRELRYFRNAGYGAMTLVVLVITLMVATLAVIVGSSNVEMKITLSTALLWGILGAVIFLTVISLLISCYIFLRLRKFL